jgi:hypothetical protein
VECHDDIVKKLAKAEHKTISCEACHGVGKAHVDDPDQKLTTPGESHCLRCHETSPSRPAWLRQVDSRKHYSGRCSECHLPHQPLEVP